jgi:hypothetical protein
MLALTAGAAAASLTGCGSDESSDGWNRGRLHHLLPTASHRAFNIKLSFFEPIGAAPVLRVGTHDVPGTATDSHGRFWAFRVGNLTPDTEYQLQLRRDVTGGSEPLCDPWPLRTLPAPDDRPERLRIISFTCAGGPDLPIPPALFNAFRTAAYRRRLFDLMLEEKPDAVVANGDHVYFDLPAAERMRSTLLGDTLVSLVRGLSATFDPALPVLGSPNEVALTTVGDDQIAQIYGVRFRSTPIFFITDDHDYFDNDDATPDRVSFPPDAFHQSLRNSLQRLYFPEFIVERGLDEAIPGGLIRKDVRLSSHFGEMQYGDLFTGLFYDCGGYLELGENAGLIPASVEAWLLGRTTREDTRHLVHFPSHPMGWTAGKWREWYRDLLTSSGALVAEVLVDSMGNKYMWQEGWWDQHQRLLRALSAQKRRKPIMVSGDLHALGVARIERSGNLDFEDNPILSILSGPVGVGDIGWPSRARGVESRTPNELTVSNLLELEELNGFTILDFDRERADVRLVRCPEGYVSPSQLRVETASQLSIT